MGILDTVKRVKEVELEKQVELEAHKVELADKMAEIEKQMSNGIKNQKAGFGLLNDGERKMKAARAAFSSAIKFSAGLARDAKELGAKGLVKQAKNKEKEASKLFRIANSVVNSLQKL